MPCPRRRAAAALLLLAAAASAACFASRRVHPRSAEELRRGYGYVARGDLELAGVAFSHALEFDPDLVEARNGLGVVARSRGDLATALRHFTDALALDDLFAEGHANAGEARLALGDLDRAERSLRKALSLNPDLVEARLNLGRALLRRGLAEPAARGALWMEARDALLHALEADSNLPGAHADLALIDYLSGKLERAEASWARAADLSPSSAEAAHGLCLSRAAQGRCAEALPDCQRCLRLSPGEPRCLRTLLAAEDCARK